MAGLADCSLRARPRRTRNRDAPIADHEPNDAPLTVGGSALPGGVMMRTRNRVGIAVRSEDTGEILTDCWDISPPTGRWATWPLARGVYAMRTALSTGQRALRVSERLRWQEGDAEEPATDPPKILLIGGALLGAAIQVLAFRVGPVVIAKEAGLTGAAFIVADAALRLFLLLGLLWALSLLPPFRRILAYHGAEHQSIAAHEARAPLTAAVAAGFTRFHPRCGTSFLVVSAVVSIVVYGTVLALTGWFSYFALIATRILGAPLVTAIAFELQRQAAKRSDGRLRFLSSPGMLAQRLTTAEPGPEELEVAVAALKVALEQPETVAETASEPAAGAAPIRRQPSPQPTGT